MNNADFDYNFQYRFWHSDTEESCARDKRFFDELFELHALFPKSRDASVLELGCGMGRCLLALRERGYSDLTGVDLDRSQIEVAQKSGLNVFLQDAESFLDESDRLFDAIYCFDLLEHVAKEKQLPLLRRIAERLTPNGRAVFQVPNALSPTAGYFRYTDFTHNVSYTDVTMKFLLANAGLQRVAVRPQNAESLELQRLKLPWARLYRTEFGLDSFILTSNLVAVAFKNDADFAEWSATVPTLENRYSEEEIAEHVFLRGKSLKAKLARRLRKWGFAKRR